MFRVQPIGGVGRLIALPTVCCGLMVGCGGEPSGSSVSRSPDEVAQTKRDLQKAMQSGAYGSAGKKAAGAMGD